MLTAKQIRIEPCLQVGVIDLVAIDTGPHRCSDQNFANR
jgi:hypothetical protein